MFSTILIGLALLAGIILFIGRARLGQHDDPPVMPERDGEGQQSDWDYRRALTSYNEQVNEYNNNIDNVRKAKKVATIAGSVCLGIAAILLLFTTVYTVGTREVGIVLTFKKPVGTASNGIHTKWPWQSVETMDAAIQTDNHTQRDGKASDGETKLSCITTRIAHQAVACVDVSIRWRIKEPEAGALFQNYRTFDNVRDSLVTRDLNSAVNTTMETYDVLAVDANGQSTAPQLNDVANQVNSKLASQIGSQIDVLSVIIPVVHFDDDTQKRVNALQAQISQTRIAEQAEQTAKAQAKANAALAQSVSNDPNVLVSKCLDLVNEAIAKNYQLNPAWNCFGGSSNLGVLVPSGK